MRENNQVAVRIDGKGRISLPQNIRATLEVECGNTVFLTCESEGKLVRLTRAVENPVAVLWEYAQREYKAGRTRDLREYAREQGVSVS